MKKLLIDLASEWIVRFLCFLVLGAIILGILWFFINDHYICATLLGAAMLATLAMFDDIEEGN